MGWSVGFCDKYGRDIGYGVPAICDHPGCNAEINRGVDNTCGGIHGGEFGCGLHLCSSHLYVDVEKTGMLCYSCITECGSLTPKPDVIEWVKHKLTHSSWEDWRKENKESVFDMNKRVALAEMPPAKLEASLTYSYICPAPETAFSVLWPIIDNDFCVPVLAFRKSECGTRWVCITEFNPPEEN